MTDAAMAVRKMGQRARKAARLLATASGEMRQAAIKAAARQVRDRCDELLDSNCEDVERARRGGLAEPKLDRLALDAERIAGIVASLNEVAALPDPVGQVAASWERPNGLRIRRVRTPLGVVGVVFESRPNVCADAGALCVKSGNAAILRGGSESLRSASILRACLADGLEEAGLPADAVQVVETADRAAVGEMLAGAGGAIDVLVPRGGRSLVERVEREARVPVFAHLEGVCHVYMDSSADLAKARSVVVNAKMRRTSVCGAAECLLVDRRCVESHLPAVAGDLIEAGCSLRGDEMAQSADSRISTASDDDWGREYLDAVMAVRVVDGVGGAIDHIRRYGSSHTDAVLAEDDAVAERFFRELDSAILMRNASTQFADGGEFGLGAEIGIATGKLHARGPIGAEQLTTFQYHVEGNGAVRP